jgi:hypothetical protein
MLLKYPTIYYKQGIFIQPTSTKRIKLSLYALFPYESWKFSSVQKILIFSSMLGKYNGGIRTTNFSLFYFFPGNNKFLSISPGRSSFRNREAKQMEHTYYTELLIH